jgi:hypothetical protein
MWARGMVQTPVPKQRNNKNKFSCLKNHCQQTVKTSKRANRPSFLVDMTDDSSRKQLRSYADFLKHSWG